MKTFVTYETICIPSERVNDQHFDRMNERMRVMTRWTVGTIALFGTLITVLIAVAEFVS